MSDPRYHKTVQGIKIVLIFLIKFHSERLFHVVQKGETRELICTVFPGYDVRLFLVVLVEDISDDLLENVLHRDDAGKLTILIHHKFDVDLLGLHLLKKSVDIFRLGDEMRASQKSLDLCDRRVQMVLGIRIVEHIAHVKDADDIVDIFGIHRKSRIICFLHDKIECFL